MNIHVVPPILLLVIVAVVTLNLIKFKYTKIVPLIQIINIAML
jgi:hypothetical protein